MIQEHIYSKDITRNINGVIKADSKAELANELLQSSRSHSCSLLFSKR